MLEGLSAEERADLHISLLIAHTDPRVHPTWNEDWVYQAVDEIHSYNVTMEENRHLQDLELRNDFSKKGVFDYTYALKKCHETGAPYIGFFEDDILLAEGWAVRTLVGLKNMFESDDKPKPWLYMRLFNQERSTGWENRYVGGNNEHWIILAIWFGILFLSLIAKKNSSLARRLLETSNVCVILFILVPGLVILFFQCGKASLLPPSPGVFEQPFGCCSQAMIYPREQIPPLIEYLTSKERGQIDLLLDEYAVEADMARYSLYPVQAQHIGESIYCTWPKEYLGLIEITHRHQFRKKNGIGGSTGYLEHGL